MPGVSPEPGSTGSAVNPSQLQPGLRRALNSSAEGSPSICPGSEPFNPLGLRNVNGIAERCDYFAFALSRYIAMKMYLAGLREGTPEILREYARMAVVKAKLLGLFLGHPKTKISGMPFVADWDIWEPYEKAQGII